MGKRKKHLTKVECFFPFVKKVLREATQNKFLLLIKSVRSVNVA